MTGSPVNHEGSSRANIHHIIVFQLFGEKGRTKSLVPANVATSEENHQCRLHFEMPNDPAQRQPPESTGGAHDALPNYPRLANGKRGSIREAVQRNCCSICCS